MRSSLFVGTVVDVNAGSTASLRVEAYDLTERVAGLVTVGHTDVLGRFTLALTDEQRRNLFGSSAPVLYFRVLSGEDLLVSTQETLVWPASASGRGLIEVDISDTEPENLPHKFSIEGVVCTVDGVLLGSETVDLVLIRRARSGLEDEALESTTSHATTGRYRIEYDYDYGATGNTLRPDLLVKTGSGQTLVKSAAPRAFADIVVGDASGTYPGLTTYGRTVNAVNSVVDGKILSTFDAEDIDYVVRRGDVSFAEVEALVNANIIRASNVAYGDVSVQMLFGLLVEGFPAEPHRIFGVNRKMVEDVLIAAKAKRTIDANLLLDLDTFSSAAHVALSQPLTDELAIGHALSFAPSANITTADRDEFIDILLSFEGTSDEFWLEVDGSSMHADAKAQYRFGVEIAGITGWFETAVQKLYNKIGVGDITADPSTLATYDIADWELLVDDTGFPTGTPGSNDTERKANYAKRLQAAVESRFRMEVMRARVTTGPGGDLQTFLAANPTYDIERIASS